MGRAEARPSEKASAQTRGLSRLAILVPELELILSRH
jgi:hypothetical protein